MARDDPDAVMTASNDLVTAAVVSASQLPAAYRQDFESKIAKTLQAVFGWSFDEAVEMSKDFMSEARSDMNDSQLLYMFHQSPLQIAAGLAEASNRDLTEDEIDRYRQIMHATDHTETERPTDFGMRMG